MPIKKVLETIRQEALIESGDKVLVAFSGGPDSACLLHILKELEEELGISLYAAHLNHQIRGIEAHEDALFSYRDSKDLGVPCFLSSVNVPKLAEDKKLTIEEAARVARYEMLFELKEKLGIQKVAIAHNLDDQAETILMRIMRGTGLNGLKGMEYKRADGIIRPLMDVKRYEIEDYCNLNNILYRVDKTNLEDSYTRNKIRIHLIPFIENNFVFNIKEILSRMANGLREDSQYIEEECKEIYEQLHQKVEDYGIKFELESFENMNPALLKRLLRYAYTELLGSGEGLESIHLEDALKIINSPKPEAKINFPKGILAEKKRYYFYVTKKSIESESVNFEYKLQLDGITEIPELSLVAETKVMSKEKCKLLSSSSNIKSFDIDKIQGDLVVRTRRPGDKIKPLGFAGTKKIKDIFIDKKIPVESRGEIPIISDESKIIWIVGHDISEESKIGEASEKVVRIAIKPMNKNEKH